MKFGLLIIFCLFLTSSAVAANKVAVVKLLRGEVDVLTMGKTAKLKAEDWVETGAVVKTGEKSFVKLVFVDKSQMNIGPNSEMKIEKFGGSDSGVIDLVKGKIRSQVTKDYLQVEKDKSKLFIKTSNAVMGVRGTDFLIATNGVNTSTILFEGEIAFSKLENRGERNTRNLEDAVNRGVRLFPGEFSVVDADRQVPTVPALLNVQQRETLERNESFEPDRSPGNSGASEASKSVVPPGLSGTTVGNDAAVLKREVGQVAAAERRERRDSSSGSGQGRRPSANAEGFVSGGRVKPTNGSFLHVGTGIIIPPGPGSQFDPNTNTFIPVNSGRVNGAGDFVPPPNVEITPDGKVLMAVKVNGQTVVQQVPPPTPVMQPVAVVDSSTSALTATTPTTTTTVTNDIINTSYTPSGLTDISNNDRNVTGGIDPTVERRQGPVRTTIEAQ
jgi:hypothetical protein